MKSVFRSIHHPSLGKQYFTEKCIVRNLVLLLRPLLGCNDDDTIRNHGTINSGSRSIFQYGETLDIVRVNHQGCYRPFVPGLLLSIGKPSIT